MVGHTILTRRKSYHVAKKHTHFLATMLLVECYGSETADSTFSLREVPFQNS